MEESSTRSNDVKIVIFEEEYYSLSIVKIFVAHDRRLPLPSPLRVNSSAERSNG